MNMKPKVGVGVGAEERGTEDRPAALPPRRVHCL